MIEYILLLLAYPLGIFARNLTKDEKHIYRNYFQAMISLVFVLAIVFAFFNRTIFLTFTFMLLMLIAWNQ